MDAIRAASYARRHRRRGPELALVREPDRQPCPGCGRAVATVWGRSGAVRAEVPAGRLPALVEVTEHWCGREASP